MTYFNTNEQAVDAFLNESFEFAHATQDQVDYVCARVGDDYPQMRWDNMQEEIVVLLAEARAEFCGVV